MWSLEFDDGFYRIYDSNKQIAGYFDPDYGDIFPKDNEYDIIQKMIKNKDKIVGGFLMIPMVKFGLFDTDLETEIDYLQTQIQSVLIRIEKWRNLLPEIGNRHVIRLSHTDQDMLSITIPVRFSQAVRLDKNELRDSLEPILGLLHKQDLL